jgi:pyruvate/2-oxoglutarate dehydrogenase complex dihydrolipoamide dehydrogenase (E3) component
MKHYKHLIIGTGQATGTLLGKLIPTEQPIGVIEADQVGGSCINYGCTPTKTLVASARAFHQAKQGHFYGFSTGTPSLNYARVWERMNEVRASSQEGLMKWMQDSPNVDLIYGEANFVGSKKVSVREEVITADYIYINVGTRPRIPAVEGLENIGWLDSARLLERKELPDRILILGGGYIGVEFAQIFARFGSEVTLVQRGDQLLPREDSDIAENIQQILQEENISVRLETNVTKFISEESRKYALLETAGMEETVAFDEILIAAGRIPNADRLNLEATGLSANNRGYIEVNDYCETAVDGVFAVGDVNGQGGFTHTAVNDAEIVLDRLFGGDRTLRTRKLIYALFTDPPLGRVGMSEKEALESGRKVLKATRSMDQISRAKEMGETKGFAKLLVDAETDLILGVSILGVGGDEIINMFASIMHSEIPCREYRKVVLVHPTVSELMPWTLDGLSEAN